MESMPKYQVFIIFIASGYFLYRLMKWMKVMDKKNGMDF